VRAGADHHGGFGLDQLLENPLQRRADGVGQSRLPSTRRAGRTRISTPSRRMTPRFRALARAPCPGAGSPSSPSCNRFL
jgi:hypothetical protein